MKQKKYFRGAASLFMVVFTALLLSVLVLSFIKIMIKDQERASRSDLSQSAYDSAMAGVEDAKRAVAKYINDCVLSTSGSDCVSMKEALSGNSCDAIKTVLGGSGTGESIIGATDTEKSLDQAYTCVKIQYQTPDYLGKLDSLSDVITIPINGTGEIDRVIISWFTTDDFSSDNKNLDLINYNSAQGQWAKDVNWPSNRPPVVMAQYFRFSSNLTDYDRGAGSSKTVFLVPSSTGLNQGSFSKDSRTGYNPPISPVSCKGNLNAGGYACEYTLVLPEKVTEPNQAFIRLSKRYSSKATFRVRLRNGTTLVNFDGVQPMVDSNGRANDLFRRVEARIQPLASSSSTVPTPLGAVRIEKGDFCKDFSVSDTKMESWGCN